MTHISKYKDELYLLFVTLYQHPIPIYQLAVCIKAPSLASFTLLTISVPSSLLILGLISGWSTYFRRMTILGDFIRRYPDCSYTQYSIKDYLSKDSLMQAETLATQRFVNGRFNFLGENFEDSTRIYVVKRGKSSKVPSTIASYAIPFIGSYIFVRDDPEEIRSIGKFQIHHEIGHTLLPALVDRIRLSLGSKTLIFFIVWVLLTVSWKLDTVLVFIAFVMVLLSFSREWSRRDALLRLSDEIAADTFAVWTIPENVRGRLYSLIEKYPLRDKSLNEMHNEVRNTFLRKNLRLVSQRKEKNLKPFDDKDEKGEISYSVLSESGAFSSKAPFEIYASVTVVFCMGFFSKEFSVLTVVTAGILLDMFLLLLIAIISALDLSTKNTLAALDDGKTADIPEFFRRREVSEALQ